MKPKNKLQIVAGSIFMFMAALPCRGQFTWTTNNGTITITGYTGPGGVVSIPSSIDGFSVTGIASRAFSYLWNLTAINLLIPDSVTSIEGGAFYDSPLVSIEVSPFNPSYSSVDGVLFNKDGTILVQYPCYRAGSYVIPNTVITIDSGAFAVSYLSGINIPETLTTIGASAFSACFALGEVAVPDSVTVIGDLAFFQSALTNVWIGAGVASIGLAAFSDCEHLLTLNVDPWNYYYSSSNGVLFDSRQTRLVQYPEARPGPYVIPNTVNTVDAYAFSLCFKLTDITIPYSVTNIGLAAFKSCTSLTKVDIPGAVTSIADITFQGCTNLTDVTIPESITYLGYEAFDNCVHLTNIIIPESVETLSNFVFSECVNLEGVYFKGNAPFSAGSFIFDGDDRVTVYYLPGSTGWEPTFSGRPAVLWNPQMETSGSSLGVGRNGFGFNITGTTDIPVVVEASTSLRGPAWAPLLSCILTNGSVYFSDPQWSNYPARFYRIRSP